MSALSAVKPVGAGASRVANAVLKMSLHDAVGARPMRFDRAVALGASQLSLSVAGQRLVYCDGVPSLVGPQFAIFDHGLAWLAGKSVQDARAPHPRKYQQHTQRAVAEC